MPGLDFREIEEFIEEMKQGLTRFADMLEHGALINRQLFAGQNLSQSQHDVQEIAQFMAHAGKSVVSKEITRGRSAMHACPGITLRLGDSMFDLYMNTWDVVEGRESCWPTQNLARDSGRGGSKDAIN